MSIFNEAKAYARRLTYMNDARKIQNHVERDYGVTLPIEFAQRILDERIDGRRRQRGTSTGYAPGDFERNQEMAEKRTRKAIQMGTSALAAKLAQYQQNGGTAV